MDVRNRPTGRAGPHARADLWIGGVLVAAWAGLALLLDVAWDTGSHMEFAIGHLYHLVHRLACGVLWLGIAGVAVALVALGVRKRSWIATAVLLLGLATAGAVHGMEGQRIGRLVRFHLMKHRHQAVVAALASGGYPGEGPSFKVDDGPPLRVAFPLWQHPMDNWCGYVYDPTGLVLEVMKIESGRTPDDPMLQQARSLFGGELYACEPLGGYWYYCWFT